MSEQTAELAIENWDDRSSSSPPGPHSFGFVYFNDGSRVGYAPATDTPLFEPRTNGGGEYVPISQKHIMMARDFLHEQGIM